MILSSSEFRAIVKERNRYRTALRSIARGHVQRNGIVIDLTAHACRQLACLALAVRSRNRKPLK